MSEVHACFAEWLATRPECVQKLCAEFPPMTEIMLDGVKHWVLGYNEDDGLLITHIDPSRSYSRAKREHKLICAQHLRDNFVRTGDVLPV